MSQMDDDDNDLDYTRQARMKLIASMTNGGMPSDNKDRQTLLAALDGMDRAALAKKRIKSEEGISSSKALAAETIAQIFMDARLKSITSPTMNELGQIPLLRNDLPVPDLVDGELETNPSVETYDSFMSRHGGTAADAASEDEDFKE